jgi:hypothetical protein
MRFKVEIVTVAAALGLAAVVTLAQVARAGGDAPSGDGWTAPNAKALTLAVTGMT